MSPCPIWARWVPWWKLSPESSPVVVLVWKCTVRLLEDPSSLKEKRSVVRRALEAMRQRHGLSAAEVGEHDRLNLARFGFCTVGSDSCKLESLLEKARVSLEAHHPLEVVDEEVFLENYG
jgi:uncharacterized protein YlxP (DUF503 family)